MPPVKNDNLTQELVRNLDLTNQLVRELITDIHAGEVDFAKLSAELSHLVSQFKYLSESLSETDDDLYDMNIKIALMEKTLSDLQEWSRETQKKEADILVQNQLADKKGKWQMATALVTGVVGVLGSIIAIILNYLSK